VTLTRQLTIFEAHARAPQSMTVRMFQIVNADRPKPFRTRQPDSILVARRGPPPCAFPTGVIHLRDRLSSMGEDEIRMIASAAFDCSSSNAIEHHIAVDRVLHLSAWNDENRSI
jgi:hypothetical protein